MAKRYPQYSFEVVATQEMRSSEGRRLKRLLKLEKIQRDIEVVALAEVVGDYLDDKLEGEVVFYRENGNIEKVEEWSDGKLVKTRAAEK
jgi:hypothetical protein